MTITTTVTFQDLIHAYDDELAELEDAYAETVELAEEEHGGGALDRVVPRDSDDLSDDLAELAVLQQQAALYEQSIKEIQKRQNVLERLADEYDGNRWELKMLRGDEMMEIGQQLNIERQKDGVDDEMAQVMRQGLLADAGVVSGPTPPGGGELVPSECENPLRIALYEQVERLNQAGDTDFRAPGFGESDTSLPPEPSAGQAPSEPLSTRSDADATE